MREQVQWSLKVLVWMDGWMDDRLSFRLTSLSLNPQRSTHYSILMSTFK